jgi:hypothetical protein
MLVEENAIFVFTKDRPRVLFRTLKQFRGDGPRIVIIDDSAIAKNSDQIRKLAERSSRAIYHGKLEQSKLRKQYPFLKNRTFFNYLGDSNWNLGFARNHALILSKALKLKSALFMDDDIKVSDPKLIANIFKKLEKYDFIGSRIKGMVDDSVSGHIVRHLGLKPEEYFSGGFIAFSTNCIQEYFINEYNEDWFWMYLHNFNFKFRFIGNVYQEKFDPFYNGSRKGKGQEFGELLADGIREAYEVRSKSLLFKLNFWKDIQMQKEIYYREIIENCRIKKKLVFLKIIEGLLCATKSIRPIDLQQTFKTYFKRRKDWNKLLKKIK